MVMSNGRVANGGRASNSPGRLEGHRQCGPSRGCTIPKLTPNDLVNEKAGPPFTRNEEWSEWVADDHTMGPGPRS